LLTRILIGVWEILPRVDVRAAYDMYYRHFLLWAIIVGLFVKFAYVHYLIRLSWSRGAVADIAMNSASSLLNLIAVPVAYLVWTLPRLALNRVFGTDDTAPVNWVAVLLVIAMISALSEAFVLKFVFKQRLGQKRFWLLYIVNAICIGVAAYGMGIYALAHPPTA
jgi:hypothetical protein